MKTDTPKVQIQVAVPLSDLVEEIAQLDHDNLFTLISTLDDCVADYDFTKRLRDHFDAILKKCDFDAPE